MRQNRGTGSRQRRQVQPLTTLEQKLDPRHTALLVVDLQNDFCADGGAMAKEGFDVSAAQGMAERLPGLIAAARAAGTLVIFVRNVYSTDSNVYLSDVWLEQAARRRGGSYIEREVCAPGSWGGEFYGEVDPLPGEPIVSKHRFDAFLDTDLELVLRSNGVRTVVVSGVATNVCCETTARHAFLSDYYVVFVSDATAAYASGLHDATLQTIDQYFGQVVTIGEIQRVWVDGAESRPEDSGATRRGQPERAFG